MKGESFMKKILRKGISCILSMLVLLQGWLFVPNGAAALEEDWSPETTTAATTENVGQVQEWEQFQYQVSENEVTIVGYVGTIEGTLEIPAEIDGLPVTRVEDDAFIIEENGKKQIVCTLDDVNLLGDHNYENILAAIAVTYSMGVPVSYIKEGIKRFKGVEHRIEYVDTVKGVAYYNDSKGTNPDAAIKGIKAMNRPTWLIGGGYDKKSTYDEWIEAFDGKVKELILMGVTAPKIADCAKTHGFDKIKFVDSMEEAVSYIAGKAQDGEAVLLSPACASWGMFPNYEVRGDIFKDCVRKLKEN